jgi:uncharacterized membrane protein
MIDNNRGYAPTAIRQSKPSGAASTPAMFVTLILAIIVNVMVFRDVSVSVIRPVLGFWFVIVFPSYLAFTSSVWRKCGLEERWGYSVCSVLLILMLSGLVLNEGLPLVGVQRPLDAGPVIVASDAINLSFYVFRNRYPSEAGLRSTFFRFTKQEFRLLVGAGLTVVLTVFGANHLNNGASAKITLIALAMMALIGVFAIRWLRFTANL